MSWFNPVTHEHSINVKTMASGDIKVQIKIWDQSTTHNTRVGFGSSGNLRVYAGRAKQVKDYVFNDFHKFPADKVETAVPRWLEVNDISELQDEVMQKVQEEKYIYE